MGSNENRMVNLYERGFFYDFDIDICVVTYIHAILQWPDKIKIKL